MWLRSVSLAHEGYTGIFPSGQILSQLLKAGEVLEACYGNRCLDGLGLLDVFLAKWCYWV